ncbi:hypothetical protein AVEN_237283-1 [Araneus ventricosus]|uniref:Uncharacterized protein n=1 Tax=Araneus ventricosus TaxID=182803 RepID=A0A4Y2DNU2_ARAVE|nr:hypothetical protein AVEN_237283-1 [Araneus ventricosus]
MTGWVFFNSLIPRRLFLLAPLKPGLLRRERHKLDSPNLGGHLPHRPTPCYKLRLKLTEMGCGSQVSLDPLYRVYVRSHLRTSLPIKISQPSQTCLHRCYRVIFRPPPSV